MKKILTSLLLLLAISALAQEPVANPAPAPVPNDSAVFNSHEITVKAFSAWSREEGFGGGAAVTLFPFSKYLGAEVSTIIHNDGGTLIDNVGASGIVRLPIGNWYVAPYCIGGVKYNFDRSASHRSDYDWTAGGGLEIRVTKHVGVFGDYQRLILWHEHQVRAGLTFTF